MIIDPLLQHEIYLLQISMWIVGCDPDHLHRLVPRCLLIRSRTMLVLTLDSRFNFFFSFFEHLRIDDISYPKTVEEHDAYRRNPTSYDDRSDTNKLKVWKTKRGIMRKTKKHHYQGSDWFSGYDPQIQLLRLVMVDSVLKQSYKPLQIVPNHSEPLKVKTWFQLAFAVADEKIKIKLFSKLF